MSNNPNALVKALSDNQEVVVYAIDATAIVQESMERLDAWPPATKHLGQAMMSALLLQALDDTDGQEVRSLQWMCEGPFGHCFAEARGVGEVRGTISNPRPEGVTDYETTLGEGVLQVRRTIGQLASPNTSVVKAVGQVSLDMVEYLEQSEQKNCGINLSVKIDWADEAKTKFHVAHAYGYLVHVLPQPTEAKLNETLLRWDSQINALGAISQWAIRPEHATEDMARLLLSEHTPKIVMKQRVLFSCNCSEDRAARALAMLETQEEKEGATAESALGAAATEIRCEFCGHVYVVAPEKSDAWKKGGPA